MSLGDERVMAEEVARWRDPLIDPPPRGRKILLFVDTGVVTIGHWGPVGYLAWAPLIKVPGWLEQKLNDRWAKPK